MGSLIGEMLLNRLFPRAMDEYVDMPPMEFDRESNPFII